MNNFIPPSQSDRGRANLRSEVLTASLRQLGNDVLSLSDRLAILLHQAGRLPIGIVNDGSLVETISAIIKAREERCRLFPPSLFSDPAWEILLCLFLSELRQIRVSFSRLTEETKIPATTAHRWVDLMLDKAMLVRRDDPLDARRAFIELHPQTSAALRDYFSSLTGLTVV